MLIRPPLVLVIAVLAMTGLSLYNTYTSWMDIEGMRRKVREAGRRLPAWYPLRGYMLDRRERKGFVWQARILNSAVSVIMLLISALMILAWIIGK